MKGKCIPGVLLCIAITCSTHLQAADASLESKKAKGHMARLLEKEVPIRLESVSVETVLAEVSRSAGINIVAANKIPALTNLVSVNVKRDADARNLTIGQLFRSVGEKYNVHFEVGDELIWVTEEGKPGKKGQIKGR